MGGRERKARQEASSPFQKQGSPDLSLLNLSFPHEYLCLLALSGEMAAERVKTVAGSNRRTDRQALESRQQPLNPSSLDAEWTSDQNLDFGQMRW